MEMSARTTWWLTFALFALQGLTSVGWAAFGVDQAHVAMIAQIVGYLTLLLTFAVHGSLPGVTPVTMPTAVKSIMLFAVISASAWLLLASEAGAVDLPRIAQNTVQPAPPKQLFDLDKFVPTKPGSVRSIISPAAKTAPAAAAATAKAATAAATVPAAPKDPLAKLMQDLASIKQDIIAGVIGDLNAADADAATIDPKTNQMRDPIAHACYPAQVQFLQNLPQAQPLQGKFVAVQLHQRVRDFVLEVRGGLPTYLKLGCAPMLGDDLQIIVQTLGTVGVQVGSTLFSGGLSLPVLPALALPVP
jgi:hypothetical protein